jgi:hypothetical protein
VKARIVEIVSNGMLNAFSSKYEKENGAKGGMRPVSTPRCPVKADITISPKSTRLKIIVVIATSKVRNTREAAGLMGCAAPRNTGKWSKSRRITKAGKRSATAIPPLP